MKKMRYSVVILLFVVCLMISGVYAAEVSTTSLIPPGSDTAGIDKDHMAVVAATVVQRSNAYLEYAVADNLRFSLGTTGGDPSTSNDNNKKLLYGHPVPSTSYTTIRVDGTNTIYGSSSGVIVTAPTNSSSSTLSAWKYNDIQVTQTLSFVTNPYTNRPDVLKISYRVQNTHATASHLVGVRCMLDTMLGSNDAAPFRIPGVGEVTYERQYNKTNHNTPQYWQAFDSLTSPTVTAQGTFIGNSATEPSVSQFTNWGRVYNTMWGYVINPALTNGDSAVSLTWNDVTLAHGQTVEYVTYYGIGSMTGGENADIALTLSGPAQLSVVSNAYSPNPFTIVAYVQNKKVTDISNVKMVLTLPAGLTNVTPLTQYIALIPDGETRQVSWSVRAATQSATKTLTYKVNASGSQIAAPGVGVSRSIILPGIGSTKPRYAVGTFRPSTHTFYLQNKSVTTTVNFGSYKDLPVAGDWNKNGLWDVGTFRPSTHTFYLKNGSATTTFSFGSYNDLPVAGDWNKDGYWDVGTFRPSTHTFYLKNGSATTTVNFGSYNDLPVAGDWNGDGRYDVGTFRPSTHTFYLKNGSATTTVNFGSYNDLPVAGDWNADGYWDVGTFRPSTHTFYLKNGSATTTVNFGSYNDLPVSGHWS